MSEVQTNQGQMTMPGQTIVINQQEAAKKNGVGTAGFVLAIIAIALFWVPVLDFILWVLGLILSFAGVFKKPRGLAIAGLSISLIGIILIIAFVGSIGAALGSL